MTAEDRPCSPSTVDAGLSGGDTSFGLVADRERNDPLLGRTLAGVTVLRLVAEGGMGRVYEGLQDRPRRRVAVKVMRPGLTTPAHLRRFESEAQVLARLQHPRIAHVYGAGTAEINGATVPYFVMEFVPDALTLTEYATARRRSRPSTVGCGATWP